MAEDTFVYVIFIESTPEKVWQALTDGAFTRRYWAGRRIDSDWAKGAAVRLYIEDTQEIELRGEVLEYDPPRRLSYTWDCKDAPAAGDSTVTFELHPMGGSVRLTVTHGPLAADDTARQGWSAILSSLKSYLETGKPLSATEMWRSRETECRVGERGEPFQADPDSIRWRMHFRSGPGDVFQALATPEGRSRFWAESAHEQDGMIHFVVPGGLETRGRIIEAVPDRCFAVEYFGWTVRFDLSPDPSEGGTDLEMVCRNVPAAERVEAIAGWVSVLMAMKAAVDFGVDLRNHDSERTWWQGYADN